MGGENEKQKKKRINGLKEEHKRRGGGREEANEKEGRGSIGSGSGRKTDRVQYMRKYKRT